MISAESKEIVTPKASSHKPQREKEEYLRPERAWMLIGIGRSSFYAMQKEGSKQFVESFPKPYWLSGRTKVWSKAELIAWVESRAEKAMVVGGAK